MQRALELAAYGGGRVSPNPFVGAVIVARGRIIGEGYHRKYGGPHAEPNAIASVSEADRPLLREATMYVTLEPCSHFGKTPPCASLLVREGIKRVVIACEDPFLENVGSGIDVLRSAGIEVECGLMRDEARFQNRRFLTAHTLKRPFILLKWAQSADGFIGRKGERVKLSTPLTEVLMHRERSLYDAIMAGTGTVIADNPNLTCRLWPARNDERPAKLTFRSERLPENSNIMRHGAFIPREGEEFPDFLGRLYREHSVTSLMVEGGAATLSYFLDHNLADEIRIETSPLLLREGVRAPQWLECVQRLKMRELEPETWGPNSIRRFVKNY